MPSPPSTAKHASLSRAFSLGGALSKSRPTAAVPATFHAMRVMDARKEMPGDKAGDSDSEDEDKEARLPRSLLSPVPSDQLTTIVVFGADGNLARLKLLPTLFELWRQSLLPADVLVVGFARPRSHGGKYDSTSEFRRALVEMLPDVRPSSPPRGHRPAGGSSRCSAGDASTSGPDDDWLSSSLPLGAGFTPGRQRAASGDVAGGIDGTSNRSLSSRASNVGPTGTAHLGPMPAAGGDGMGATDPRLRFVLRCHYAVGSFDDPMAFRSLLDTLETEERKRLQARKHGRKWLTLARARWAAGGAPAAATAAAAAVATAAAPSPAVRMFYMSVPPFLYATICTALTSAKALASAPAARGSSPSLMSGGSGGGGTDGGDGGSRASVPEERYVLEKPFGTDSTSCAALIAELSMLKSAETYYIDHYLGKELVMNLLVLRFANVCFGAIWNRQHIKSVQVIFKEKIGCEGRAGYFDQYGIIRDVMQNHVRQIGFQTSAPGP